MTRAQVRGWGQSQPLLTLLLSVRVGVAVPGRLQEPDRDPVVPSQPTETAHCGFAVGKALVAEEQRLPGQCSGPPCVVGHPA